MILFTGHLEQSLDLPRPSYSFNTLPADLLQLKKFFLKMSWCTIGVVVASNQSSASPTEAAKAISAVDRSVTILLGDTDLDTFDSIRPIGCSKMRTM